MPTLTSLANGSQSAKYAYIGDWIGAAVVTVVFYSLDYIHGFWREFSLNDPSIQHTFATHERVPVWALYLIAVFFPFAAVGLVNYFTVRSLWDWHHSSLGLLLSLSGTGALTQIVKVTVGRPRPDLIDRCIPIPGSHDGIPFGLVTSAICTQTNQAILKDGFRSFFSGHSSLSFAGLGFLSWYLAGKTHLFDRRGHAFWAWVSFAPLAAALLVAISRTMDYRHHWQDVTVGSLVGLGNSFFAYRQYFSPLTSPDSQLPLGRGHLRGPIPVLGANAVHNGHEGYSALDAEERD